MNSISIVSATRQTETTFFEETWLGISLLRLQSAGLNLDWHIFFQNKQGLSRLYNQALKQIDPTAPVIFIHDDACLQDLWLIEKLALAFQQFDIVGIAGGNPPAGVLPLSWYNPDWDLSGCIAHGNRTQPTTYLHPTVVDYFGPTPKACQFLDGVFLATIPQRLLDAGVQFDERFEFHHYDLDFCLGARQQNLTLGTWPIWLAHSSTGQFQSPVWQASAERFQQKYLEQIRPSAQTEEAIALVQTAIQLKKTGQLAAALAKYEEAIALDDTRPDIWFNLGNLFQQLQRRNEAEQAFEQALALNPDFYQAHLNLANSQRDRGAVELAISHYRRVIELKPDFPLAYQNLGQLHLKRDPAAAQAVFAAWARQDPENPAAFNGVGIALQAQGQYDAALRLFQQALAKNPQRFDSLNNLGTLLRLMHRPHEALPYLQQAIQQDPQSDLAQTNLIYTLLNLGQVGEALAYAEALLTQNPNSASGHLMYGFALVQQARAIAAMNAFQRCIELEPTADIAIANGLFTLLYRDDLTGEAFVEERQRWVRYLPDAPIRFQGWQGTKDRDRRLKIGYLSGDFRSHPVAFFLEPILAHHDPTAFEIYGYDVAGITDDTTTRLQRHIQGWRTCVGWDDPKLAQQIHDDGIDILVDLSGHTADNRAGVLRCKPAPLQMLYIGYPDSTGLETMDYLISNEQVSPPELEALYQEKVLRVDGSFWCFQPHPAAPPPNPLPALTNNFITFGSFNNSPKLSPTTIHLWSQVLQAIPTARLILKALALGDPATRDYFRAQFVEFGVGDRVIFQGPTMKLEEFFQSYHQIDIALDPTPYNGGTTTCEALWMGVPVITLRGDRFCARMSHSLLHQVGLSHLSAASREAYIATAVTLAEDLEALQVLRGTLRDRMVSSSICDASRATLELENAYRRAWADYCHS
jgi:predicted O-linked N-acetylglucosamine transferase (SPINDLY family)